MRCKQKQKPKDAITYCRKVGYVVTSTVKSVIKKGIINKTKVSGHGKGLKSRGQNQVNQCMVGLLIKIVWILCRILFYFIYVETLCQR